MTTASGRLLVLISHTSEHESLIRAGQTLAAQRGINWQVVWVDTGRVLKRQAALALQSAFSLARELGAETTTLRGPNCYSILVPFIAQYGVNGVLLGAGDKHRLNFWSKPLYQELLECGLALEITVIASANNTQTTRPQARALHKEAGSAWTWQTPLFAAIAVFISTIIAIPLERLVSSANLILIYVLSVMATGLKYGWRTAVTASLLAFFCFNFFLTEPRYTLHVTRQDELATLLFMLIIALACGPAASRIRRQLLLLHDANRYSEAMRLLGQELSIAKDPNAIWQAIHKVITEVLNVNCIIVPAGSDYQSWPKTQQSFSSADTTAIDWARQHHHMAGRFSPHAADAAWTVFALHKDQHNIACVLVKPFDVDMLSLNDKTLIAAMANQAADTWRRTQLASELEAARVTTEVEQLRSALLSSVSHDLKSPLAAMMGAAESLRLLDQQLDKQDRYELMDTIVQESRRLESYIQNLLDMTRLGYGTLKIERDWVAITDILGSALARLKRYYPNIQTETHFNATPVLYVHAALIEQALFNILENAARFTPEHEKITLTLSTHNNQCLIAIADQGPGIPEALREKIFDMFFGIAEGDQKKQNSGMGLAICRGMIGAHGGSVTATSNQKSTPKGTVFTVKLPLDEPPTHNNAQEDSQ